MIWFGRVILDPATVEQVVWTLLHFAWQGLAIAGVFALVNARLRRSAANRRYVAGCAALAAMAVAPLVTFYLLDGRFDDPGPLVLPGLAGAETGTLARARQAVEPYVPLLLNGWAAGAAVMLLRHLAAWLWLRHALSRYTQPLRREWEHVVHVANRMGARSVRFVESTLVDVPATAGWLKPVVLIPAATVMGLRPDQLEALVAHELAHVRRHDYLVNLLQTALEVLLFFHPAVWWVSHRVRQERENCCDDVAARVVGDPIGYAEALTALEASRQALPRHALGATGRGPLWRRVARLVPHPGLQLQERTNRPAFGAALLSCAVVCATSGYLFANAVAVRPAREIDSVRTLSALTYDVAGSSREREVSPADFLAELDRAVARIETRDAEALDWDALVDAIGAADPAALERAVLERVHAGDAYGYQRLPDWTHGTYAQRASIVTAIADRGRRLHADGSPRAGAYARAAVLLAAQDGFVFGWGRVGGLVHGDWFAAASGLTDRDLARLRRHVNDHVVLTRVCKRLQREIERHLDVAERSPAAASSAAAVAAAREHVRTLTSLSAARPDVQWQVANLKLRLGRLGRDGGGGAALVDLAATDANPTFRRWLAEAAEPDRPNRTRPIRVMSTDEVMERMLPLP